MEKANVKPADGKLGVLCVGLGAVATTFITGVLMARKGLAKPVGSMWRDGQKDYCGHSAGGFGHCGPGGTA